MTTLSNSRDHAHDKELLIPASPLDRLDKNRFSELDALGRGLMGRRASVFDRWFAPRQLPVRGAGRTMDLSPSSRSHIAALSVVVCGLLALAASFAFALSGYLAASHMAGELEHVRVVARAETERAAQDREALRRLSSELLLSSIDRARAALQVSAESAAFARQKAEIGTLIVERDKALADRDAALIESRQVLRQLSDQTRGTIAEVEGLIASTGIDMARVVKATATADRAAPRGGPFIPWRGFAASDSTIDKGPLSGFSYSLDHLQALHDFLVHLPLSSPLAHVTISDGFGFRHDPLSDSAAMHEGIDLRGPRHAGVYATAAGVVSFAGWWGEYGNMVEIDHGFGLKTRYAHLDKALVGAGEFVALHQKVGLLGSTGRVTGAHLHYEVRVDDRARNPVNFLKGDLNLPEGGYRVQ